MLSLVWKEEGMKSLSLPLVILFINCTLSQRSKREGLTPLLDYRIYHDTMESGAGLWWIQLIVETYLHYGASHWQPQVLHPIHRTREVFKVALHWSDRSLCSENIKTYAQVIQVIYPLHFEALIKMGTEIWVNLQDRSSNVLTYYFQRKGVVLTASPLCSVLPSPGSDVS